MEDLELNRGEAHGLPFNDHLESFRVNGYFTNGQYPVLGWGGSPEYGL
ncbi:MAG: hypothetical protein HGA46_10140, partial [Chlorobiaceae bacterium]|nr:hypothetical protein [Chlorobiaceae bacterium]